MVCLLAAPWVQLSVSAGSGWSHNALRHHWLMPISYHFRDYKALLVTSLTHVSGAIASVQTRALLQIYCWVQHSNNFLMRGLFAKWNGRQHGTIKTHKGQYYRNNKKTHKITQMPRKKDRTFSRPTFLKVINEYPAAHFYGPRCTVVFDRSDCYIRLSATS